MKLFFALFIFSISAFSQTKLALNWKPESEFGGFYEAQRTGLYQSHSVEILEGGSGTPTAQMLMNGTVDFAIVSAEEIILSADRDPKRHLVAVFSVFETSPYIIMAHKEFKTKNLAQLFQDSSQTISLQKGLPYVEFLLKKFNPVKAKIVPYTGGIALFKSNAKISQQGFITSEAIMADQAGFENKTWLVADEGFNPYITVLAVRVDFLKNNKAQVQKMVEISRAGWIQYLQNPKLTNALMNQKNPSMSVQLIDAGLVKMKPLMKFAPMKLGQMQAERWAGLQKLMLELSLIKNTAKTEELFQNF